MSDEHPVLIGSVPLRDMSGAISYITEQMKDRDRSPIEQYAYRSILSNIGNDLRVACDEFDRAITDRATKEFKELKRKAKAAA